MNVYKILDSWGLNKEVNHKKYSKKNYLQIAEEINNFYSSFNVKHDLGKWHLGVTDSVAVVEGNRRISELAMPLLMFNKIWLPDPTYSLFDLSSDDVWGKLPDSGSSFFSKGPHIYTMWSSYFKTPGHKRDDLLEKNLSKLILRMLELRPLIESNVIQLYPWEMMIKPKLQEMRKSVITLIDSNVSKTVATKYTQDQYNLGPRLSPVGIELSTDDFKTGLKAGTKMWIGDTTPVFVCGLINTILTKELGASFLSSLPGDRIIHDYIRTGGITEPYVANISNSIKLPRFSEALWDDIVAIRNDSETMSTLRDIIQQAAAIDEEAGIDAVKERMHEVIEKIKEDKSLWKVVHGSSTEVGIGAMGGFLSGFATGDSLPIAALGAATGAGVALLWELYKGTKENNILEAKTRIELLTRINSRL